MLFDRHACVTKPCRTCCYKSPHRLRLFGSHCHFRLRRTRSISAIIECRGARSCPRGDSVCRQPLAIPTSIAGPISNWTASFTTVDRRQHAARRPVRLFLRPLALLAPTVAPVGLACRAIRSAKNCGQVRTAYCVSNPSEKDGGEAWLM